MKTAEGFKAAGSRVCAWVEQEDTVHLRAADEYGDPVELTAEQLKSLIDELSRLYDVVKPSGPNVAHGTDA